MSAPVGLMVEPEVSSTSATLTFATGFSRVFTGVDADDLEDQIRDFLLEDGATEYAKLLKLINSASTAAVTDGNPFATTALMARAAYDRFAYVQPGYSHGRLTGPSLDRYKPQEENEWVTTFTPRYGTLNGDNGDGQMGGFELGSALQINNDVGFYLGMTSYYIEMEGSDVFQGIITFGFPITLVAPSEDKSFLWQLTPYGQAGYGLSVDMAAGGLMSGYGLVNSMSLGVDKWLFTLANQYGQHDGIPISASGIRFDPDISQQVVKNGIRITKEISDTSWLFGGVTHSQFLNDAVVGSWISPEIGIETAVGLTSFKLGYRADLANDYEAHSLILGWGQGF